MGSVVFRRLADNNADDEAGYDCSPDTGPVVQANQFEEERGGNGNQEGAEVDATVQGCHQFRLRRTALHADDIHADNGKYGAEGSHQHRSKYSFNRFVGNRIISGGAQSGGSQDGTAIGFVQISAHTGHVPHVVTHVIGDRSRIAGVVFRDTGLNLANIGGLRENTSAHAGKESLEGCPHTKRQHGCRNNDQAFILNHVAIEIVQYIIPCADVEHGQADYRQSENGSRTESDLQTGIKRITAGICYAVGRISSRLHPDIPGKA